MTFRYCSSRAGWLLAFGFFAGAVGCEKSAESVSSAESSGSDENGAQPRERAELEPADAEDVPGEGLIGWYRPDHIDVGQRNRVVRWRNAAADARHLVEATGMARPSLAQVEWAEGRVVDFDGEDDQLAVRGQRREAETAHVFVVAAPGSNRGQFDGLVSAGIPERNDDVTGLSVDLGGKKRDACAEVYPDGVDAFNTINVQSAYGGGGCGQDLYDGSKPFDTPTLIAARIGQDEVTLRVDGGRQKSVSRPPQDDEISLDALRVGARFFGGRFQGFFDGVIAEVLIFGRGLSGEERSTVEGYLVSKYGIERQ